MDSEWLGQVVGYKRRSQRVSDEAGDTRSPSDGQSVKNAKILDPPLFSGGWANVDDVKSASAFLPVRVHLGGVVGQGAGGVRAGACGPPPPGA